MDIIDKVKYLEQVVALQDRAIVALGEVIMKHLPSTSKDLEMIGRGWDLDLVDLEKQYGKR